MLSVEQIIDSELLRAFAAFSNTCNFTLAAREVGLSQPALFERIRKLSDQLEVSLYERHGRELRLTAHGARVAAFARESLEGSARFLRDLRGAAARESVVFASGEGAFLYLLGPALASFAAAEPEAHLTLLTLGAPAATAAVLQGTAHAAVAAIDLVPPGIVSVDLRKTPLCAAIARHHPLARKRKVRLAELARHRPILAPEGRAHRAFVSRALSGAGLDMEAPLEADGWPLMLQFASLGLGVAVVNGICAPPRGVVLRPIPELGTVTYRLLTRRGARLPSVALRLVERLRRGEG